MPDTRLSLYDLWWPFDRYGFEEGIGTLGRHTPEMGLHYVQLNLQQVAPILLGWPLPGLAASSVPWILLGAGGAVALLGVAVLTRPRRAGAALVAIIGLGLIVVPLALSIPSKSDAGVNLQRAGSFVFSPKIAPAALATTGRIARMIDEVQTKFLPQTAGQLHESPARVNALVAHHFPVVAQGLAAWPSIRAGAFARARDQVASIRDAANVDGIDVRAIAWMVIGPGILALLAGATAFALSGRARPPTEAAAVTAASLGSGPTRRPPQRCLGRAGHRRIPFLRRPVEVRRSRRSRSVASLHRAYGRCRTGRGG